MSQFIKLEKRFEDAMEKLEFALSKKIYNEEASENFNKKEEANKKSHEITENLLNKIEHLEKAAKNDAKEIGKLVMELKEILETEND